MKRPTKWDKTDIFTKDAARIEEILQDRNGSVRSSFTVSKSTIKELRAISKMLGMNYKQVMDLFFGDGYLLQLAAQLPEEHYSNTSETRNTKYYIVSRIVLARIEHISSFHNISRDSLLQNAISALNERLITDDQKVMSLIEDILGLLTSAISPLSNVVDKLLEIEDPLLSSVRSEFFIPAQHFLTMALFELKGAIKDYITKGETK